MRHNKLKTLAVIFDDEERNCYSSGERVSGHVLLELSASTKVKTIKVFIKGYAQVCWTDRIFQRSEQTTCLSLSKTLVAATGTQDLIIECGTHEYPFELELPQSPLVSSFTGKYGSVYYMVQAVLKRPLHESQCVCRKLSIISHIDVTIPALINIFQTADSVTLQSPVSQTCEKMIGHWVFTSGPISLTVNMDRKGYCNGESIPIYAEIENCSSRLVVPKAMIYIIQTYMANGKTKIVKQLIASVRGNIVPSDCSDRWNGKSLKIPPVSPSILNSYILRVEYLLAVIVQIPGAKNLKVKLPLVIGTIPYGGLGTRCFGMSSLSSVDMSFLTLALPGVAQAPPSYADVVSREEFKDHRTSTHQSQLEPPPLYSEVDPNPIEH